MAESRNHHIGICNKIAKWQTSPLLSHSRPKQRSQLHKIIRWPPNTLPWTPISTITVLKTLEFLAFCRTRPAGRSKSKYATVPFLQISRKAKTLTSQVRARRTSVQAIYFLGRTVTFQMTMTKKRSYCNSRNCLTRNSFQRSAPKMSILASFYCRNCR